MYSKDEIEAMQGEGVEGDAFVGSLWGKVKKAGRAAAKYSPPGIAYQSSKVAYKYGKKGAVQAGKYGLKALSAVSAAMMWPLKKAVRPIWGNLSFKIARSKGRNKPTAVDNAAAKKAVLAAMSRSPNPLVRKGVPLLRKFGMSGTAGDAFVGADAFVGLGPVAIAAAGVVASIAAAVITSKMAISSAAAAMARQQAGGQMPPGMDPSMTRPQPGMDPSVDPYGGEQGMPSQDGGYGASDPSQDYGAAPEGGEGYGEPPQDESMGVVESVMGGLCGTSCYKRGL